MGIEAIAHNLLLGIMQDWKGEGCNYTAAGITTFSSVNYLRVPEALNYCLAQLKFQSVEK